MSEFIFGVLLEDVLIYFSVTTPSPLTPPPPATTPGTTTPEPSTTMSEQTTPKPVCVSGCNFDIFDNFCGWTTATESPYIVGFEQWAVHTVTEGTGPDYDFSNPECKLLPKGLCANECSYQTLTLWYYIYNYSKFDFLLFLFFKFCNITVFETENTHDRSIQL